MAQPPPQPLLLEQDDPLTETRVATSVWEPPNHPPGTTDGWRVASLEAAGDPGVAVQSQALPAIDARPEARSVCIALVKRDGEYKPVVDGLVPEEEVVAPPAAQAQAQAQLAVRRFKLTHHRGYHEAPNAKTTVFSPCAVVVLLEDGQSAPVKCSVQMWQQMEQRIGQTAQNGNPIGDQVMMDDREVRPCRAASATCAVVYAPYPVRFARSPRVGIYDMQQVYRAQLKAGIGAFMKTVTPFVALYVQLLGKQYAKQGGIAAVARSRVRSAFERAGQAFQDAASSVSERMSGGRVAAAGERVASAAADARSAIYQTADVILGVIRPLRVSLLQSDPVVDPYADASSRLSQLAMYLHASLEPVLAGLAIAAAGQFAAAIEGGSGGDPMGVGLGSAAGAEHAHVDAFELKNDQPEAQGLENVQSASTGARGDGGGAPADVANTYAFMAGTATFLFSMIGIPSGDIFNEQFVREAAGPRGVNEYTFFEAVGRGINSYLTTAPFPTPNKVWFTIAEFAQTLESLSVLLPIEAVDLNVASEDRSFRNQALVYRWLTEQEEELFAPDEADDADPRPARSRGILSPNPIDVRDLFMDPRMYIRTILKVIIDDRTTCDEKVPDFEFECHRDDAHLLGLVAAGCIEDLERLQRAIGKFEEALDAMIDSMSDGTEPIYCWIDWAIVYPVQTVVKQLYRRFRPTDDDIVELLVNQRKRMMQWVKSNLGVKLRKRFTDSQSRGQRLLDRLKEAKRMQFLGGNAKGEGRLPTTWIRRLGHRALSPSYLFPATRATELDYTDTQAAGVVVREYSAYHDAAKVYSETTKRGRDALARLLVGRDGWEALQATRLALVVACDSQAVGPSGARYRYEVPTEAYSLALLAPADVRLDAIVTTLAEQVERRIRLLCHGTQSHWRPSPLAALKVPETELHSVAVTLYAELWTDELVTQHRIVDATTANVVAALEPASVRAARRLTACARFVLETTAQYDHGFFDLTDSALAATLAGRDSARLRRRLAMTHPSTDFFVRETMQYLRDVAKAMVEVARLWSLSAPKRLPSEPLASLFSASPDGDDAFDRVKSCLELLPNATVSLDVKNRILEAACGAYPAVLLAPRPRKADPIPTPHAMPTPDRQRFVRDLRKRMAMLRIPIDETIAGATPGDPPPPPDVAALTKKLGALEVASKRALFYVPFGYGDPSPRLVFPPVPSVMLGSVPVWSDAVVGAIDSIADALNNVQAVAATWTAVVKPTYRCSNDVDNVPHPATILVTGDGSAARPVARFRASACPGVPAAVRQPRAGQVALHGSAHIAALHHRQEETCLHLQASVASIAWNAERVLQSLLALVASSDDNTRGHFELEFEDDPDEGPRHNARARGYLCLACAIGAGMAEQSLGDRTPTCSLVTMAGQPQLDANEQSQIGIALGRLQNALDTRNNAAPVLRLSEVCAIAYGILIS